MSLLSLNSQALLHTIGYAGLVAIVFAESGLFFGFFFPGDSLLFTAGLFAALGAFNIWALLLTVPIAAVLGDAVGYAFGSYIGPRLFVRDDSLLFKKRYVTDARHFYERYGPRAIFLARFVPIIRTFVPIVAGVAKMRYRTFFIWNALGGLCWGVLSLLLGYFLGNVIPNAEHFVLPISIIVIFISFVPIVWEWQRSR